MSQPRHSYVTSVFRIFAICAAVVIAVLCMKGFAYGGYFASDELKLDIEIGAIASALISLLSPAIEKFMARTTDEDR